MCLLMNNMGKVFIFGQTMTDKKPDRRVQRTRQLLQEAFHGLLHDKPYDAITIQDITERANVGRTTFYLHYDSKEDLLLEHYGLVTSLFRLGSLSRDELLADEPPLTLEHFLIAMVENTSRYYSVANSKAPYRTIEGLQRQMADDLLQTLQTEFVESDCTMPLDVLARYIAGAALTLMRWWIENRTPYDAHQLATMLHRLQRATICEAFAISLENNQAS